MGAQVTKTGIFNMQVCVPQEWTDEQVTEFANRENMAGTSQGWQIEKEGHDALAGDPERVPCAERVGYVHIMLEC